MNASTHPFEQEEVMAYLDGELSANRAASVAAHLRECAECAALAEQMREVSGQLTNWSVEAAPASLNKSLEAARADRSSSRVEEPKGIAAWVDEKFAPLRGRWAWGVGGAVAVAVLLLVIGRQLHLTQQNAGPPLDYMAARTESKQSRARASARPERGRNREGMGIQATTGASE